MEKNSNKLKCPKCGAEMVLRQSGNDKPFWGCSNYAKKRCKGTRPID